MNDLTDRDITAPVLLRFPDILDNRIEKTAACFEQAEKEYDYKGEHFIGLSHQGEPDAPRGRGNYLPW